MTDPEAATTLDDLAFVFAVPLVLVPPDSIYLLALPLPMR